MSTENHSIPSQLLTLRDFKPALEAMLETESKYCLVGGLAVGQWAEALLAPSIRERFDLPVRSKDIDIRASKSDAMMFVKNLQERGASPQTICKRVPKDATKAFPSIAIPIQLRDSDGVIKSTTVEALSGMPLLDTTLPDGRVSNHGTPMRYGKIYLLDPCSLLICKLNAIHTRPPGESDNDGKHATILSLVIPRFIQRTLDRLTSKKDKYHPFTDSERLAGFLNKEPWSGLIPLDEKERVLKSCNLAKLDWERRKSMETKDHHD